jgi:hypothetical protein
MNRQTNTLLALAGAVVLVAGTATAQQAAPAKPQATTAKPTGTAGQATAAPAPRLAAPIRGVANLGVTKPVTKSGKVEGKDFIITTMKVKNMSSGSIAGLKADEFWLDKAGNPVGGDTFRYRKPLQPNEVIEITFSTPRDAKMSTNQYRFSHANGDIKTQLVPKL